MAVVLIDADGYSYEDSFVATVSNVAPVVKLAKDRVETHGRFDLSGTFVDPGSDKWTGTVDFGDGSAPKSLKLNTDKTFAATYTYKRAGVFKAKVTVRDDDGGEGIATCTVVVRDRSSNNARLIGLKVEGGLHTLHQNVAPNYPHGFTSDCLSYFVEGATITVHVDATTADDRATLKVFDPTGVGHWDPWSGDGSLTFYLVDGKNVIQIKVTAEDGRTTSVYRIENH